MPYPLYFEKERVGVGKPNPTEELDVRGNIKASGDLIGTGLQVNGAAISGTNTGDVTLTAVGSTPAAAGASLSGQVLTLQPASATLPGVVTAAAQSLAGAKTFTGGVLSDAVTSATAATLALASSVANGGSAVAGSINSSVTLSTAGAKIFSFKNNGTEKAAVDKDGNLIPGSDEGANLGTSALRWASVNTDALKCQSDTRMNIGGGVLNTYTDGIGAPGGASVAHSFTTHAAFATAGGKLLKISNLATEKASFSKDGALAGTYNDSSGTPGSATADTVTGRSAIALGASAATITTLACTATSVVMVTPEDLDSTLLTFKVVPGSGSFVVTGVTTATAAWKFRWIVFNGA